MIVRRAFRGHAVVAALGLGLLLAACGPTAAGQPAATSKPAAEKPAAPAPTVAAPAAESGPRAAPAEPTTVRVFDQQITSSAGNYIGAAKGYFREEGIQVE